jgi:CAAX prenyl protease-like protein
LHPFVADLIRDINPRRWTGKYLRTSVPYLIVMVLFYHAIGIALLVAGSIVVQSIITDYKEPLKPITVISVIFAGPIEETLFFGIPLYATGSHLIVMAGGILWAMWHLLGPTVQLDSLAYSNWLFVLPSIFLSFRTWISGKGWFAIVAHSVWNISFFSLGCVSGEIDCKVYYENNAFSDIVTVSAAAILTMITFSLYRAKQKRLKLSF